LADVIHELCKDIVRDFFTKTGYSVEKYSALEHFRVKLGDETKDYLHVTEAQRIWSSSDNQTCYWLNTNTVKRLKSRDEYNIPTFICVVDFKDGRVYYEKLRDLEERTQIGNTCYPLTFGQEHVWNKCQFTNSFTIKDYYIEQYKMITAPTKVHELTDKEIVQRFAKLVGLSPREVLQAAICKRRNAFEDRQDTLNKLLDEFAEGTASVT